MVGGLGAFGFDEAIGYAGEEEQGGRAGFRSRRIHDKASMASMDIAWIAPSMDSTVVAALWRSFLYW